MNDKDLELEELSLEQIMKEFGEESAPEQENLGDTQDLLDVISEIDGEQPQAVQPESEVKAEAEVIPTSNAKVTLADLEAAAQAEAEAAPAWAETALTALKDNGINLAANEALTRGQVAQTLYQASLLALDAPGMQVFQ